MKSSISLLPAVLAVSFLFALPIPTQAQRRGQPASQTPRTSAPIDFTGYWVSVITEDWRYRMITPGKGDYGAVPISPAGRKIADSWDPAKDESAGEQCKAYGAAAVMRRPGRLHIVWDNDTTLRVDIEEGTQTRLLRFGQSVQNATRTWQGYSAAQWQPQGNLKVVTTQLLPGYLRKNGVPYGESAVVTEYFERVTLPNKDELIVLTSIVEDPVYLTRPFVTSSHFKKLPGAEGWKPTPCSSK